MNFFERHDRFFDSSSVGTQLPSWTPVHHSFSASKVAIISLEPRGRISMLSALMLRHTAWSKATFRQQWHR
jgi:hypothetical protein